MKAVTYSRYGGPDALVFGERPEPKTGPDSVLVRVRAASVNPVDWKLMAGGLDRTMYVEFPVTIGWDVAGTVVGTGLAVTEYEIGDDVIGYVRMDSVGRGTFAELVAAPVRTLARKPVNLSWTEAAALPLAGLTAYQALRVLEAGDDDTVLILNGSGGVGTFAIQLARAFGAQVVATSSPKHHGLLRRLGAIPVDYGDGLGRRLADAVPDGVDAIADFGGGEDWHAATALLSEPGRIASITDPGVKRESGSYLWAHPDVADLQALTDLVEVDLVRPVMAATFPLRNAVQAYRLSMHGHTAGKIAVTV